jgi:hypothetical protein
MKNTTEKLPSEFSEALSNKEIKTASFRSVSFEKLFTYAPNISTSEFLERFPNHTRITGLLGSSGSSWAEMAFIFYVGDCFDPPLYVQFGSSWEDAYESFCDNEPSLLIHPDHLGDYGQEPDLSCSFNSDGQPIDTGNVQSFTAPLSLVSITF